MRNHFQVRPSQRHFVRLTARHAPLAHRRDCRTPQCGQVDPVQPPRRQEGGAGGRPSRRHSRPPRGRGEASRARIPGDGYGRIRGRGPAHAAWPDAAADRGRGSRGRRRAVPDRRPRGAYAARRGNRAAGFAPARRRSSSPRTRPRGMPASPGGWRPMPWGSASRSRSAPSMARASSTCSRACARSSSATRRGRGGRGRRGSRSAAEARDRRPAERGQVDAGQPDARRGADDHRPGSRDHPRLDHARLGVAGAAGAAGRYRGSAGSGPRSRTSSRSFPARIRAARSSMPRSSSFCSTQRAGWRRRTCASPTTWSRRAGRSSSRSTNGTWRNMPRPCSTA